MALKKISVEWLRSKGACEGGLNWVREWADKTKRTEFTPAALASALMAEGVNQSDWAIWFLVRLPEFSGVRQAKFFCWLMTDKKFGVLRNVDAEKFPQVAAAVKQVAAVWETASENGGKIDKAAAESAARLAESAAESAESAESAARLARLAESAAESAESAESAARLAWLTARSAARLAESAESAARSAWLTARSAARLAESAESAARSAARSAWLTAVVASESAAESAMNVAIVKKLLCP